MYKILIGFVALLIIAVAVPVTAQDQVWVYNNTLTDPDTGVFTQWEVETTISPEEAIEVYHTTWKNLLILLFLNLFILSIFSYMTRPK